MEIINYTSREESKNEFYPTPVELAKKMFDGINLHAVETILEPSAGKGDILSVLAEMTSSGDFHKLDIDCIELDNNLRAILKYRFSEQARQDIQARKENIMNSLKITQNWNKEYTYYNGKKADDIPLEKLFELEKCDEEYKHSYFENDIHIVHDDFLTYNPFKEYDLIIMNPPFSGGDKHLLKALDIQKHGGKIICILNAETLRNPYTESRKQLVEMLNMYNAEIEYIENAFLYAERKTAVEIALVRVDIPKNDNEMSIFERLATARHYDEPTAEESYELEVTDFIQSIVNRYKVEVESGIELIKTYNRMLPYLHSTFDETDRYNYDRPLLILSNGSHYSKSITVNEYVKSVRLKYWRTLLNNQKFIGKLTDKLQREYREKVTTFADYDFSEFNIRSLMAEMNAQIKNGIESEIISMYDRLTEEHSYYTECSKNRHLYDGWKTNKAWKIDKKVIIPCYGVFDRYDGRPRVYEAYSLLSDIERILNFFDGNMTAEVNLHNQLERNFRLNVTKNIECKFFKLTCYKKGTVHITFNCPELIDRFNIYVAQNKGWLPPSYGKKAYSEMDEEEKAVIDSYQGEDAYNKVMNRKDYYLAAPALANQNYLAIAG